MVNRADLLPHAIEMSCTKIQRELFMLIMRRWIIKLNECGESLLSFSSCLSFFLSFFVTLQEMLLKFLSMTKK